MCCNWRINIDYDLHSVHSTVCYPNYITNNRNPSLCWEAFGSTKLLFEPTSLPQKRIVASSIGCSGSSSGVWHGGGRYGSGGDLSFGPWTSGPLLDEEGNGYMRWHEVT